jgi:uncharacterized protein (TIGR02597 family)
MKTTKLLYLIPAALVLSLAGALAQSVASPPIGFNKIKIKNNSDTNVSVPFHKKPFFTGVTSGALADGAQSGWKVISLSGTPGFTADAFNGVTYVRITEDGHALEGRHFQVVDNDTGTITFDSGGSDVSTMGDATGFTLVPYTTLGDLFPSGGGLPATAAIGVFPSLVLIPDNNTLDINKGVTDDVYFYHSDAWRNLADPANWVSPVNNSNGAQVDPGSYVIVRLEDPTLPAAPDDFIELCVDGRVPTSKHAVQIDIGTGVGNDNHISLDRPIPITLDETGLGAGFVETTDFGDIKDVLLVFDSARAATNKGADNVIVRFGGQWFDVSAFAPVPAEFRIQPGDGLILRKAGAASASSEFIVNTPSY